MSWETFNEEGFRTLHDVQSFRGVRNPARSQNARFSLAHRLAATFPGAGNGMSAMRVLRFASAARAGSVSRPSSLWRPTKCAWMFGRRPGAPCSDTANTSVPWKESLQDTTRLYPAGGVGDVQRSLAFRRARFLTSRSH